MSEIPQWRIAGEWFDNCSCAVACPCTFAQAPDNGFCDYVLFWHIDQGHFGETVLDDLSVVRVGRFEGALWSGEATVETGVFLDRRADEAQLDALRMIFSGQAGGFPEVFVGLFSNGRTVRGEELAEISFEIAPDQSSWGVTIADKVKAWAKAITGPTSPPGEFPRLANAPGSETGPGPQLVTWGKSTTCRVEAFGFDFGWTVNSAKHIPFDWSGPRPVE